jgi:hypothetical protein
MEILLRPWPLVGVIAAVLLVLWVLVNLKSSRKDGTLQKTHPYRTMLCHLLPERASAMVFFDTAVNAEPLRQYVEAASRRFPCDPIHCLVGAVMTGLAHVPRMNRFTVGARLYQRHDITVTFSMKRKKLDEDAKLAALKVTLEPHETFAGFCRRLDSMIGYERTDAVTPTDKEFKVLLPIPAPLLALGVRVIMWLDRHNILPHAFIKSDAFYTSMFIANLGSLKMGAGYHHLYNWGNCPIFMMVGQIEPRAVVEEGRVVVRDVLPLRFTYDERIDDGINAKTGIETIKRVLEDPFVHLGCLKEDGSDAPVLAEGLAAETRPLRARAANA